MMRNREFRHTITGTPRRRVMAAAALAPVLAGAGAGGAYAATGTPRLARSGSDEEPLEPIVTTLEDWADVAEELGRPGEINRDTMFHVPYPRRDLVVVSEGVTIAPGLALGSHIAFTRYADDTTLLMGDLVVSEPELQPVCDVLIEHGIALTAIHKHLLQQEPGVWWMHVHGHARDPMDLARAVREAFEQTSTPPAEPPEIGPPDDLDTIGIDAALGAKGVGADGLYKVSFVRSETIVDAGFVLPQGLGSTTALTFQPVGDGRAAVNGDFAMIADEVYGVEKELRRGGVELVTVHNHSLADDPRLFFLHFWAVDDGVKVAKALRRAVNRTNVETISRPQ